MSDFTLILISGVGLGALYFLVASGLSLIYGLMGVLNFAHGVFLAAGAFGGFWVTNTLMPEMSSRSLALAILMGGLISGTFAVIIEKLIITRLYERHMDQALVTVGVTLVVTAVMTGWFGPDARLMFIPGWYYNAVKIFGANVPVDRFLYIGVALAIFLVSMSILKFTRIGLVIRAGVENRAMVTALGINVKRAFTTVFFMGGFAAGMGGVLIGAYASGVSPFMGASWLIYGFIVVVVGGMGSIPGTALAALLIGVTKQFANFYISGLGDFIVVLLLATVLLTRPQGLLGKAAH
ncbi:MAG: branched-chain amino acid ABC transporter permease [Actinomycetota bacterium]